MQTEGWSYGTAMYFCEISSSSPRLFTRLTISLGFVAFMTIGYG